MRSLKNLIGRKKPLIDRNTGVIDLHYNTNLTIDDYIVNGGNNGRIYNQINYDNTTTLIGNGIVLSNLPTSPIGLTEGSVWRDGEGILRIV
jgi:hypothetical protein